MDIKLNLNSDFERTLETLKTKYSSDFEFINGVHPSQLDYSEFLNNFVKADTLADTSIDPNANANHRDVRSFITEKGKSSDKLFGLSKIFSEIKKRWGIRTAREWLEQEYSKGFYLNDSSSASLFPYCWANDLTRLATEGLFFLNNKINVGDEVVEIKRYNNQAPKHLTTYFDDVIEFTSFLSNRQSGAVGLPNVIIWAYYFWKKDCENGYYLKDPETYLKQNFQKFIYRLNQPFMRVDQCAFTNVSIFDRPYLESLFGGLEFPDGSFAIDEIEEIVECQKVFMEVVSETRVENMFTFPVLTFSLYYKDGKFQDEEFARWCSDHNMKWSDSNFFVSDNIGILSNCPVSPETEIMYWSDYYNKWIVSDIKTVYHNRSRDGKEAIVKVLSNGEEIDCKINYFDKETANWEILLDNGQKIITTENHLNKTLNGEYKTTKELTLDDYLPVSLHSYQGNNNLSYEDGVIIGAYLGDGSSDNKHEVCFSLNLTTKVDIATEIISTCVSKYGAIQLASNNGAVKFNSEMLVGLIKQFVSGNYGYEKRLNTRALNQSKEFRRGILHGLKYTDGSRSTTDRYYSSSYGLIKDIILLCATLGIPSKYEGADIREGRFSDRPIHCMRWYNLDSIRKSQTGHWIKDDDYMWFKIKSITRLPNRKNGAYCLEVLNDDIPEFMLANGIITHNCRLLSDTQKLDAFVNSIGGTALSVGSCRVSTINLVRIAYEVLGYNSDKNVSPEVAKRRYIKLLRDRVLLNCKALTSMRHILKRNIEKGLLPNYQEGAVELDKQFCTIGGIGMYEVMDLFGFINTDELGNKSYSKEAIDFTTEILDNINDVKDNFECDFTFNLEMIPAENCAGVICAADNLLFEQNKYYIYSNQWIPLKEKCTIQEKCRLGSIFDKKCGGGCIAHINIEGRFPNKEMAWDMLNYVASKGVIYFAFNTKISVCEDKHAFIGVTNCPRCGKPEIDKFTRVVGFYTPTSAYQAIRKQEFNERQWYNILEKDNWFS